MPASGAVSAPARLVQGDGRGLLLALAVAAAAAAAMLRKGVEWRTVCRRLVKVIFIPPHGPRSPKLMQVVSRQQPGLAGGAQKMSLRRAQPPASGDAAIHSIKQLVPAIGTVRETTTAIKGAASAFRSRVL
eukprot:CAMPEP_0113690296 /NCGR_PEP_ID=MMETSP0038_2-20120614/17696_1 /TAXON_ID=2898 /ORGANISM="Cryptomonas paramecium" /LENGTH=130 /DNA_ID=CAMNT_0000611573 /DNA_START=328 /DNA_END=721 /DNA_ORIENTATION=+ /assembly_acc=CAM_ASM_000170